MLLGRNCNMKRNVTTLPIYFSIKYYFQSLAGSESQVFLWWLKTTTKQCGIYVFKRKEEEKGIYADLQDK